MNVCIVKLWLTAEAAAAVDLEGRSGRSESGHSRASHRDSAHDAGGKKPTCPKEACEPDTLLRYNATIEIR